MCVESVITRPQQILLVTLVIFQEIDNFIQVAQSSLFMHLYLQASRRVMMS